jgi:small-conductance mechanosensitive channel
VSDQTITIGQLLVVPVVVIIGLILLRWLSRLMVKRLVANKMSADAIQFIKNITYKNRRYRRRHQRRKQFY